MNTTAPVRIDKLPSMPLIHTQGLPDASGIYFVMPRDKNSVLYIGQAVSIRTRISSHTKRNIFLEMPGCCVGWILAPYETLSALEIQMIQVFSPSLNHVAGGGGRPKTEAADYQRLTLRLPPHLMAGLKAQAAEARRPMNTHVLCVLESVIAMCNEGQKS